MRIFVSDFANTFRWKTERNSLCLIAQLAQLRSQFVAFAIKLLTLMPPAKRPAAKKQMTLQTTQERRGLKKPAASQSGLVLKKPAAATHSDVDEPIATDPLLKEIRLYDSQGFSFTEVLDCLSEEYNDAKNYTETLKDKGPDGQSFDNRSNVLFCVVFFGATNWPNECDRLSFFDSDKSRYRKCKMKRWSLWKAGALEAHGWRKLPQGWRWSWQWMSAEFKRSPDWAKHFN